MFEAQLVELMNDIKSNQEKILKRMDALENQMNGEYVTVREASEIKGCSVQAIHHHLTTNYALEPEKDWIKRGGRNLIKRTALSKFTVKKIA